MRLILLFLIFMGIVLGPQLWVWWVFRQYRQHRDDLPGTGGELARHLLNRFGLQQVRVEPTPIGDHYNPEGLLSRGFRRLSETKSTATYYPLGMLLGLLPCGPVYTALIAAARAGMEAQSALRGSLIGLGLMLSFGLGTVPSLLLVAKLADLGWLKRRDIIYKVSSILMVILGIYFVVKGIRY